MTGAAAATALATATFLAAVLTIAIVGGELAAFLIGAFLVVCGLILSSLLVELRGLDVDWLQLGLFRVGPLVLGGAALDILAVVAATATTAATAAALALRSIVGGALGHLGRLGLVAFRLQLDFPLLDLLNLLRLSGESAIGFSHHAIGTD